MNATVEVFPKVSNWKMTGRIIFIEYFYGFILDFIFTKATYKK